jgi:hypothetical protein
MGKKLGSGSGIRNEQPGSYFLPRNLFWVKILKFFDAVPGRKKFGSGMGKSQIRDPKSGKKFPGSTTLLEMLYIEDD